MATIREVAKAAGVSIATVSRVLNHPESVAVETKDHIDRVMAALGFSPNGLARSLALNKTSTLALIVPNILNPVFPEIAKGVEDVVHGHGYSLFLCNSESDPVKEREYLSAFRGRQVDGIIIAGGMLDEEEERRILGEGPVLVHVGQRRADARAHSVYTDFELGGYLATRHLLDLGYERTGFIAGLEQQGEHRDKRHGYERALTSAGLNVDPTLIAAGDCEIEGGFLGAKKLLRLALPPRAIFASNDLMAIGALEAVKAAGLRVPEDLALTGFDNLKISALVEPKLTTIAYPAYRMGSLAARLVFDTLRDRAADFRREEIYLQPELKVRRSCGHTGRIREIFN